MTDVASHHDTVVTAPRRRVSAAPQAVFGKLNLVIALDLFLLAIAFFVALQTVIHINITGRSGAPHYLLQAQSFLDGRWDISTRLWDTIVLHGKIYMVYPPFPALLLVPFVAIFGPKTSDILFTAVLSACNLPLLYLLFEQVRASGLTKRSWWENAVLSVLLFFGSITVWLSLAGNVWFTAHIVSMTCALLSLILTFRGRYGWAALALGGAFFTRGTMALGYPFLFYLAWQGPDDDQALTRFLLALKARRIAWDAIPWRRLLPPAIIAGMMVLLFAVRNLLVFGSPLETGYGITAQQNYPQLLKYGVFNPHYIVMNLVANFLDFPHIFFASPYDRWPAIDMINGGMGVSIFLTTPLFLLLFWRNRQFSGVRAALWVTLGLFVIETMLFNWTGFYQFGARYLFDLYPYAFLLLPLTDMRLDWRVVALGLIAIPINILGAYEFWGHVIVRI